MTSYYDARLKMIRDVVKLYHDNEARFNVIPRIQTLFALIKILLNNIDDKLDDSLQSTKTTTETRKNVQEELAIITSKLGKVLRSYASSTGDIILSDLSRKSVYKLSRLNLNDVKPVCSAIISKANELQTPLAPFGLTADMIASANQQLALWEVWRSATKLKQGVISTSKLDVNTTIGEIVEIMKEQLDPVVELIPNDDSLISSYKLARQIIHPGRTRTQLYFLIQERKPNGELAPVYQASVSARMTFTDQKGVTHQVKLTGKTNIEGEVSFRPVRYGFYDWEVTKPGFSGAVGVQERIKQGKIHRIVVELLPAIDEK